ncbi:MAG TPA: hypothetical protein VL426_01450 [Candidatus Binatia bacterium]|jgi:hypothetical protein|nr:hypothetical protein [Candidatus Binatia bacterium]
MPATNFRPPQYDDAENVAARALMTRVTATVQPVIDRMIGNEYRLVPGASVGFEEVRTAVFMASGRFIRGFLPVPHADFMAGRAPRIDRDRALDRAMEGLFGFRLITALGSKKYDSHRRHFHYGEAVPLHIALQPAPDKLPFECFRSALFHYWGFALARQDQVLERIEPLIGLLPKAVPVGEIVGKPDVWAIMVA